MATLVRIPCVERMRTCLRCDRNFLSLSSANRVCPECKAQIFGRCAEPAELEPEEQRELRLERNPDVYDYADIQQDAFMFE